MIRLSAVFREYGRVVAASTAKTECKFLTLEAAEFIADNKVPTTSFEDGELLARHLGYARWLKNHGRIGEGA